MRNCIQRKLALNRLAWLLVSNLFGLAFNLNEYLEVAFGEWPKICEMWLIQYTSAHTLNINIWKWLKCKIFTVDLGAGMGVFE